MTTFLAATTATSHQLRWPWLLAVICLVAVGIMVAVAARTRRAHRIVEQHDKHTRWVANSHRLALISEFNRWVRRYRIWQWTGAICAASVVVGLAFIAARPVTVETKQSSLSSRDIVLCLDISGSMLEYDRQMVDVFAELVENFDGERIALSIFNETSRTVFPLTNDYELVSSQLEEAYQALDPAVMDYESATVIDRYLAFTEGTAVTLTQSSLIGDGLANCALLFDGASDANRPRSIILATDNDLRGDPVYTLAQAADLARSKNIELNALYGASSWVVSPSVERDYQQVVEEAGGYYYRADDPGAVSDIIDRVQAQQEVELGASVDVTRSENPTWWIVIAAIALAGYLAVQGRLRE